MMEFIQLSAGILLQLLFCAFLASSSVLIARRFLVRKYVIEQACAGGVLFFWFASLIFNILINLKLFYPMPALALSAAIFFTTYRLIPDRKAIKRLCILFKLAGRVFKLFSRSMSGKFATFTFVAFTCLLLVRSLFLPMVAWDSLTYHTLKANLWVQNGCHYNIASPGLWESYKTFFGGGEAFTALAMLFTGSDLFGSIPDLILWVFSGFIAFSVMRELGCKSSSAIMIVAAFLATPLLTRMLGSGYIDIAVAAFLLSGILFFIRMIKTKGSEYLFLSAISYGLAGSIKVNGLATSLIMVIFLFTVALKSKFASIKKSSVALLLSAVPVVPWLWFNYRVSGFILGTTPAKIGSLILGQMPLPLVYFFSEPSVQSYSLWPELNALKKALSPMHLFAIILTLAIAGLIIHIKNLRTEHRIAAFQCLTVLALYFSPSFSVIRLVWAKVNGRFIISAIILITAAGTAPISRFNATKKFTDAICLLAVIAGFLSYICGFTLVSNLHIEIPLLIVAIFAAGLLHLTPKQTSAKKEFSWLKATLALIFLIASLAGVGIYKNHIRIQAYKGSILFHGHTRYWVDALTHIEGKEGISIAYTYGMDKLYHSAFIAPFFGERLQNRISYVSPLADGRTPIYHPDYIDKEPYSYEHWRKRLQESRITHLLCFAPKCQELSWARSHPESFVMLEGSRVWGFFELK